MPSDVLNRGKCADCGEAIGWMFLTVSLGVGGLSFHYCQNCLVRYLADDEEPIYFGSKVNWLKEGF